MTTAQATAPISDLVLDITEETRVNASLEATFAALLEELGPGNRGANDTAMPMVLEAWPGGRWFRDLGDGNGHCWETTSSAARRSRGASGR